MDIAPLSAVYDVKSAKFEYPLLEFNVTGGITSILTTIQNVLQSNLPTYPVLIIPQLSQNNLTFDIHLSSTIIASIEDINTDPWPFPITNFVYGGLSSNNYIRYNGQPLKQIFTNKNEYAQVNSQLSTLELERIELLHSLDMANFITNTFATFTQTKNASIFAYIRPTIIAKWL